MSDRKPFLELSNEGKKYRLKKKAKLLDSFEKKVFR